MKITIFLLFITSSISLIAQDRVNPIIEDYGGIFEIPYADDRVDPSLTYNIVVEIAKASEKPEELNWALNNVARLLNLHAMSGVPKENLHVVMVIHAGAAYTVLDNKEHKKKYGVDNPNLELYKRLDEAGVKILVCGQSLIARSIDKDKMVPQVKITSSMLTAMTTYQLKGYAQLVF